MSTQYVQAWRIREQGLPVGLVYSQSIAIDKLAQGFDIETLTIVRHENGDREYLAGTIAANVKAYREAQASA